MARNVEFDHHQAIDRATRLFWNKGYSNTSLRDLLNAMRIGEGSFYNTWKSKKRLYVECLQHYNDTVSRRRLDSLLSRQSVKAGIRAFFQTILDELDDPRTPAICLLAQSLSGDVLQQRDLRKLVVADMKAFYAAFSDRLESAKKNGELPKSFDADVAAHLIVTYLQGLFRVVRVLQSRAEVERQIEALLTGLGL
ncbi:MAG TPA: TetR/AcrR family transcriptional regulator [Candidatus Acidoferrum sp.]|nr:TetR/AcrR family transcriptional regulator [Candidatus Acidoferrum sp.]